VAIDVDDDSDEPDESDTDSFVQGEIPPLRIGSLAVDRVLLLLILGFLLPILWLVAGLIGVKCPKGSRSRRNA
jgi:hypothetical protein